MADKCDDTIDDDQGTSTETGIWPVDRLEPVLEAVLFAAGDPISVSRISEVIEGSTTAEVRRGLKHLAGFYLARGIRLIEVAGGWQLRTGPEHHRTVRRLFRARPFRLTRAATETMAVVAYKQPCTRLDVEAVRGVECGQVLESLVERRLLKITGRVDGPGRALLYATTPEFLQLFGLKNLTDLPTLGELGDDVVALADKSEFKEGAAVDQTMTLPLVDAQAGEASDQEDV